VIRLATSILIAAIVLRATSLKTAVIGSQHDLSVTGSGPVKSAVAEACIFCHAPHNIVPNITPLWNHALSSQTYTTYTSSTYTSGTETPAVGSSKLCLSCHDGTVAMGLTVAQGTIATSGSLSTPDNLTTNLSNSHPVSMIPVDDGSLATTLFATPPATKDPAVKLVAGRVECTTCHDPHNPHTDPVVPMFLARSNANGALCLACHDPTRTGANNLAGWTTGAHATVADTVPASPTFGLYGTVSANACWSCHNAHNNAVGNYKAAEEADCSSCHGGLNVTPTLPNVMGEYTKVYSHPTLKVSGAHDPGESIPVNSTRHAECADCHNPHAAAAQAGTALPPTLQAAAIGTRGYDTTGVQKPATKEYQVCYNCHADSTNKPAASVYGRTSPRYPAGPMPAGLPVQPPVPADQYNIRLKFSSPIGHNVMGLSTVTTTVPSLVPFMLNVNGTSNTSRPLTTATMLYCTDCHDNNQARSSAGTGPNGPHASTFRHLLQFDLLQDGTGGGGTGAALCAKCHNLSTIRNERPHDDHNGVGCDTCHDPHGVIGGTPGANRAMQNFDTGVAIKATNGWGYYYVSANQKGCYTVCHGENHNPHTY
jgi:hypothetical protein